MSLMKFSVAAVLLILININVVTVNGATCGCPSDFSDSNSFVSYYWDESIKKFVEVLVNDVNGNAVFEGDVILGKTADMKALADAVRRNPSTETLTPESLDRRFQDLLKGHRNGSSPWENGIVPYSFSSYITGTSRQSKKLKADIEAAIKEWEEGTGLTFKNVTSENWSSDKRMIRFRKSSDSTCSWGSGVADVLSGCVRHEIGHALGLAHEHTRNGRDTFITVNRKNIKKGHCSQFKESKLASRRSGAYDFNSIMHYSRNEFTCNNKPTLVAVPPNVINRGSRMSAGDFEAVREWHGIPRSENALLSNLITSSWYDF